MLASSRQHTLTGESMAKNGLLYPPWHMNRNSWLLWGLKKKLISVRMLPGIYEPRRICSFLKLTSCMYTCLQTHQVLCMKYVWLFVCQSYFGKVMKTKSWQTQGPRWKSLLALWEWVGEGVSKRTVMPMLHTTGRSLKNSEVYTSHQHWHGSTL